MDMGIIKNLKILLKLVNYIIEKIEEKLVTSSSTSKEISAKINILQAVQFVADSWRATSTKTIKNCFGACGFKPLDSMTSPDAIDSENNEILQVPVINCAEYLSIENNIECFDENEECKDSIVEHMLAKNPKLGEAQESDDEDPPEQMVTNQEARKCISCLKRYFMQIGNEGSPTSALDICADFVEMQSQKGTRQSTLDSFLHRK